MTNTTDAERALGYDLLDHIGLWAGDQVVEIMNTALASAKAEGYRQGQEEMRERCALSANEYFGWKVTEIIRALPITGADNAN